MVVFGLNMRKFLIEIVYLRITGFDFKDNLLISIGTGEKDYRN